MSLGEVLWPGGHRMNDEISPWGSAEDIVTSGTNLCVPSLSNVLVLTMFAGALSVVQAYGTYFQMDHPKHKVVFS